MYVNPYKDWTSKTEWLRGNFHTHAGTGPNTCGCNDLEEVIRLYKMAGYGVLVISNHDIFTDTGALAEKYGLIMLNGVEFSQNEHMLTIHIKEAIFGTHQEAIDRTNEQGGFTVINHPNWNSGRPLHWHKEDIEQLNGYLGIEVFNGVIQRLGGTGIATDVWDYLLSEGKLVWGLGSDDFHQWFDLAKSCTLFGMNSHDRSGLLDAVEAGRMAASTGLKLKECIFDGKTITIDAEAFNGYHGELEYRFIGRDGQLLHRVYSGAGAAYTLKGNELYVRMEAVNSFGAMLWTQPIYDEKAFKRP